MPFDYKIRDISLAESGRHQLRLAEPIRSTGTFVVDVELTEGVIANVKTMVVTER